MSTPPTKFSVPVAFNNEVYIARGLPRTQCARELLKAFPIPLTDFRVWDAFKTVLGDPGTDDLGLAAGAFATGCPYISAGDLKAAGATTRYARVMFQLPLEYEAGQAVTLRFAAGVLTTVADTTCTLDAAAYLVGRDALISGADLVSDAAQSINSTTFADYDFTVTPTTLSPGSWLDLRIAIACNDGATATAVTPAIAAAEVLLTVRG